MAINKTCAHCGAAFTTDHNRTKYCGLSCAGIANSARRWGLAENRFWNYVAIPEAVIDGCWLWGGSTGKSGYGAFTALHKFTGETRAHRNAWVLLNGKIPDGLLVCHRCDTPACVNPAHLFLGTGRNNVADMHAKGRWRAGDKSNMPKGERHYARTRPEVLARGERNGAAKITTKTVVDIRALIDAGATQCQAAERFGLSQSQVSDIYRRRSWAHVE